MNEWVKKYDNDVIETFVKTIANKRCEVVLFEEFFLHHLDFDSSCQNVKQKLEEPISDIQLEFEFQYLLLDWTKFINGDLI